MQRLEGRQGAANTESKTEAAILEAIPDVRPGFSDSAIPDPPLGFRERNPDNRSTKREAGSSGERFRGAAQDSR
jgi:hypothetical protein